MGTEGTLCNYGFCCSYNICWRGDGMPGSWICHLIYSHEKQRLSWKAPLLDFEEALLGNQMVTKEVMLSRGWRYPLTMKLKWVTKPTLVAMLVGHGVWHLHAPQQQAEFCGYWLLFFCYRENGSVLHWDSNENILAKILELMKIKGMTNFSYCDNEAAATCCILVKHSSIITFRVFPETEHGIVWHETKFDLTFCDPVCEDWCVSGTWVGKRLKRVLQLHCLPTNARESLQPCQRNSELISSL